MLETINRYSHGYVAIPVILACREAGFFKLLKQKKSISLRNVCCLLKANDGHLRVAIRMFETLRWLQKKEEDVYECNIDFQTEQFIESIPKNILKLYQLNIFYLFKNVWYRMVLRRCLQFTMSSPIGNEMLLDYLKGAVVVPLLLGLAHEYHLKGPLLQQALSFERLPLALRTLIIRFFIDKNWAEEKPNGLFLTTMGQSILERVFNMATIVSYAPMLSKMKEVLFGNPLKVFRRDTVGHEAHIDRTLNVLSSGFQHKRYFEDVEQMIISIFNQLPYETQPKYVIDMGCGDGTFLKRIYEMICEHSERGKVIREYPIYMIGVDYNKKALDATELTLENIPHYTLQGDVADPERLLRDLKSLGIKDAENSLHVRSFLDHDRPFSSPLQIKNLEARSRIPYQGVYVNKEGKNIPASEAVQSLVEHLARWSSIITQHGMIILEVHTLDPELVAKHIDQSENFHFDAYHGFSMQQLVEAGTFLLSAAEVGLFPKSKFSRHYPQIFPYARITLNYFQRMSYTVSLADFEDLPQLLQLERECWSKKLQTPEKELRSRLERHPAGQFVIKMEDKVVGAIYTQKITNIEVLQDTSFNQVSALHVNDGSIIQLLGFNIIPTMQDRGLGDQVLEFILHLSSLQGGVEKVVGITRCKNYKDNRHLPIEDYIYQHMDHPEGIDPILRFHTSHGAKIVGIIKNYRLEDDDNQGSGVLVEYELTRQHPRLLEKPYESLEEISIVENEGKEMITQDSIYACIQGLLPQKYINQFSPMRPLQEMGFDSLGLLELRSLLNKQFKLNLDSTFFFEYATPFSIADYLVKQTHLGTRKEPFIDSNTVKNDNVKYLSGDDIKKGSLEAAQDELEPIAIIGMACRFAGGIHSIQDFWRVLEMGQDMIVDFPSNRPSFPVNPLALKKGGYIENVDKFAASFFNISPREAASMDPQQRLLLEVSWEALENAGINAENLRGTNAGVFIGVILHDYATLLNRELDSIDAYYGTGNSFSIAAGRLSYILDLQGPAVSIDTACSSSLVAVHFACQSLRQKESGVALVGGVNLILSPEYNISFNKAGMLSPDGKCKTFDAEADGYGRGEGCGIIVLKTLSQALADGDNVLALLRSSGINQDGASNGLTAPNKAAQQALMQSTLTKANISPHSVSYIEAHGTGTILGDPTEVKAITEVYGRNRTKENPLILGSVKTNIGHTEGASGIAGLIKVVLALQHNEIPPHLHFTSLNPNIDFEDLPIKISTELMPWKTSQGYPRRASISSFGFSGTNCHIVVEESSQKNRLDEIKNKPHYLIALSAKHEQSLKQKIADLHEWLKDHSQTNIEMIAYTLNAGRAHFNYRCALVVSSIEELGITLLNAKNDVQSKNYFVNHASKNTEGGALKKVLKNLLQEIQKYCISDINEYRESLLALAEFYVRGYEIDWELLHANEARIKIVLPTYPFLRESYWVPDRFIQSDSKSIVSSLHPFIGKNVSTLGRQQFKTILKGDEFYLTDHKIQGKKIFPGVAYLEMARVAGELSRENGRVLEIHGVIWSQPLTIEGDSREVSIILSQQKDAIVYEIYTLQGNKTTVHGQGELIYREKPLENTFHVSLSNLQMEFEREFNKDEIYSFFNSLGISYGPSFQTLHWMKVNKSEALAYLSLPNSSSTDFEKYILHPSLLDGALQSILGLNLGKSNADLLVLPFSLESCVIYGSLPQKGYVHVKRIGGFNDAQQYHDLQYLDETGNVCVALNGLVVRTMKAKSSDRFHLPISKPDLYYFSPQWIEKPLNSMDDAGHLISTFQNLLILTNNDSLVKILRERLILESKNISIVQVKSGDGYLNFGNNVYQIRPACNEDYDLLLKELWHQKMVVSHVLHARNLLDYENNFNEMPFKELINIGIEDVFVLTKTLLKNKNSSRLKFLYLYSSENKSVPVQNMIGGFAKTLVQEQPFYQMSVLGLDDFTVDHQEVFLNCIVSELSSVQSDVNVRYVQGSRLIEYFEKQSVKPNNEDKKLPIRRDGVYLITGGLGGLGFIFAKYLAENYQAKLALTGRSALTQDKAKMLKHLEALGGEVIYLSADIYQENAVKDLMGEIKNRFGLLHGVIHSAGIIEDALIVKKDFQSFKAVLSAKVLGTVILDRVTEKEPLDFFVLFSSVTSCLGNVGQSDYASANAFLDSFAHWRDQQVKNDNRQGKTLSINWPYWEEGGMRVDDASERFMEETWGLKALPTVQGIRAFEEGLRQAASQWIVMYGDLSKINQVFQSVESFWNSQSLSNTKTSTLIEVSSSPHGSLLEQLISELRNFISSILKIDQSAIDNEEELTAYGFDSIGFTELANHINRKYEIRVTPALFFEYDTVQSVAKYLLEEYLDKVKTSKQEMIPAMEI